MEITGQKKAMVSSGWRRGWGAGHRRHTTAYPSKSQVHPFTLIAARKSIPPTTFSKLGAQAPSSECLGKNSSSLRAEHGDLHSSAGSVAGPPKRKGN